MTAEANAVDPLLRESIAHDGDRRLQVELICFAALLIGMNLPVFFGGSTGALAFRMDAVGAGEWWRLLTHPFVHVSGYNLLLDGVAFLLLYRSLHNDGFCERWKRLGCVAASAVGGLLMPLWASSLVRAHGLCGLSGIDHGLMGAAALQTLLQRDTGSSSRKIALASLLLVVGKCLFELVTGTVFFTDLHFGPLGVPIVACHAGGVLGAILWTLLIRLTPRSYV